MNYLNHVMKMQGKIWNLSEYKGKAYLGIDAGSTTTKAVLIGEEGEILYSEYSRNEGNPILKLVSILRDLYRSSPKVNIIKSTVTGYGEALMKAAFHVDYGIIETIAHYKAAEFFNPGGFYSGYRWTGYEMPED